MVGPNGKVIAVAKGPMPSLYFAPTESEGGLGYWVINLANRPIAEHTLAACTHILNQQLYLCLKNKTAVFELNVPLQTNISNYKFLE